MNGVTTDALLALCGPDFLHSAYRVLLGREIDAEGLNHYQVKLLAGLDRSAIVHDLAVSREGRAFGARMPGLKALLRREGQFKLPIIGPLLFLLYHGCSKRTLRRINGLREQVQAEEVQEAFHRQAGPSDATTGAEQQYISRLALSMILRQAAREERSGGAASGGMRHRFNQMVQSLETDGQGRLVPIEAPEILCPEQFKKLPPRSAAILLMFG